MTVLVIDNQVRTDVELLMAYAHENILSAEMMQWLKDGKVNPPGDNHNYTMIIPMGYRVVYTIEDHPQSFDIVKRLKHISVSIPTKYPSTEAIDEILSLFEFRSRTTRLAGEKQMFTFEGFHVWMEESARAVNVVEIIERRDVEEA